MIMKWSKRALVLGAMAFSATVYAVPPTPAMLSNACAGCHGTNGGSAGPSMPTLAHQSSEAIVDAMKKFKSGERPSTVMGCLAKGYSDEDFVAMGAFFSKQKFHATKQALKKADVKKGAELSKKNCSRCHEESKDDKDDTPAMASQWLPYLQIQMGQYTDGTRKMPEKMASKVKNLSKEELDAILSFYANAK